MPVKKKKAKIKVEEIVEEPPKEEKKETEKTSEPLTTTKIASFSQLDSMPPTEGKVDEPAKVEDKPNEEKTEETRETTQPVEAPKTEIKTEVSGENMPSDSAQHEDPPSDYSSDDVKEWLKDIRPDTTKEIEKKEGFNFKLFFFMIVVFTLIGALVGGIYYYRENVGMIPMGGGQPTPAEAQITEAVTPTPTPSVEVSLEEYKVNVLNGTNIRGEAGRIRTALGEKGFTIANVTAGNADRADYAQTSISAKADTPESVFETVKSVFGEEYKAEKSVEVLSESSAFDLVVIVGKEN